MRNTLRCGLLVALLAVGGCAADPPASETSSESATVEPVVAEPSTAEPSPEPSAAESVAAEPSPEPSAVGPVAAEPSPEQSAVAAESSSAAPAGQSLSDLEAVLSDTWDLPRLSFELEARSTITGIPVANLVEGRFDDDSLAGEGSRRFEGIDAQLDQGESAAFEFRYADPIVWMYNGIEDRWSGVDRFAYFDATGADLAAAIDGDVLLATAVEAVIEVVEVSERSDGSFIWTTRARADDLLPIVLSGGAATRVASMGGDQTGIEAVMEFTQSPSGHLVEFSADLGEWWTSAVSLVPGNPGTPGDPEEMTVRFIAETFADPLTPQAPCAEPEVLEQDGLTVFVCER